VLEEVLNVVRVDKWRVCGFDRSLEGYIAVLNAYRSDVVDEAEGERMESSFSGVVLLCALSREEE
jgi:hypothetical protein